MAKVAKELEDISLSDTLIGEFNLIISFIKNSFENSYFWISI